MSSAYVTDTQDVLLFCSILFALSIPVPCVVDVQIWLLKKHILSLITLKCKQLTKTNDIKLPAFGDH